MEENLEHEEIGYEPLNNVAINYLTNYKNRIYANYTDIIDYVHQQLETVNWGAIYRYHSRIRDNFTTFYDHNFKRYFRSLDITTRERYNNAKPNDIFENEVKKTIHNMAFIDYFALYEDKIKETLNISPLTATLQLSLNINDYKQIYDIGIKYTSRSYLKKFCYELLAKNRTKYDTYASSNKQYEINSGFNLQLLLHDINIINSIALPRVLQEVVDMMQTNNYVWHYFNFIYLFRSIIQ